MKYLDDGRQHDFVRTPFKTERESLFFVIRTIAKVSLLLMAFLHHRTCDSPSATHGFGRHNGQSGDALLPVSFGIKSFSVDAWGTMLVFVRPLVKFK